MKELLYILGGTYIKVKRVNDELMSIEEYAKFRNIIIEEAINRILNDYFEDIFYERNGLPEAKYLTREMFEVIDV